MKKISIVLAGLTAVTLGIVGREAQAAPPATLVNAIVRVNCGEDCSATGFFVSRDPPVVATCYHVVKGRSELSIDTLAEPRGKLAVTAVAPFAESDLAFLKIGGIDHWSFSIEWPSPGAAATASQAHLIFFGLSDFIDNVIAPNKADLKQFSFLKDFGGKHALPVLATFNVMELYQLPTDPSPGDSGGPVVAEDGRLLGLIAGRVKQPGNEKLRFFAAPATGTVPVASASVWKPWPPSPTGQDAYRGSDVSPYAVTTLVSLPVWPADFKAELAASAGPSAAPCIKKLDRVVAHYRGQREDLPQKDDRRLDLSEDCREYYGEIRKPLQEEEENERTSAQLAVAARELEVERESAQISGLAGATLDEEVASMTSAMAKLGPGHPGGERINDVLKDRKSRSDKDAKHAKPGPGDAGSSVKARQKALEEKVRALDDAATSARAVQRAAEAAADRRREEVRALLRKPLPSK